MRRFDIFEGGLLASRDAERIAFENMVAEAAARRDARAWSAPAADTPRKLPRVASKPAPIMPPETDPETPDTKYPSVVRKIVHQGTHMRNGDWDFGKLCQLGVVFAVMMLGAGAALSWEAARPGAASSALPAQHLASLTVPVVQDAAKPEPAPPPFPALAPTPVMAVASVPDSAPNSVVENAPPAPVAAPIATAAPETIAAPVQAALAAPEKVAPPPPQAAPPEAMATPAQAAIPAPEPAAPPSLQAAAPAPTPARVAVAKAEPVVHRPSAQAAASSGPVVTPSPRIVHVVARAPVMPAHVAPPPVHAPMVVAHAEPRPRPARPSATSRFDLPAWLMRSRQAHASAETHTASLVMSPPPRALSLHPSPAHDPADSAPASAPPHASVPLPPLRKPDIPDAAAQAPSPPAYHPPSYRLSYGYVYRSPYNHYARPQASPYASYYGGPYGASGQGGDYGRPYMPPPPNSDADD